MIQSGGCFEAVSFARSTVEIVGDLIATALGDGISARDHRHIRSAVILYRSSWVSW